MCVGDRIRARRQDLGLTVDQVAASLKKNRATVYRYENNEIENLPTTVLEPLARVLETTPAYLMGWTTDVSASVDADSAAIPPGFEPLPDMVQVPLVGRIACGEPITAEENLDGYVGVPAAWHANFALTCHGDSMLPKIHDGDVVCIHKQPMVENGQIAAVRIGDDATLKYVELQPNRIVLRPENPAFPIMIKEGEEMNEVTIEGKAVGLCRGI